MKGYIMAGLLMVTGMVQAAEYPDNPDRFPSVGLFLSGQSLSGDSTTKDGVDSASQDIELTGSDLTLDTRIPISGSTTLYGSLSYVNAKSEADVTNVLFGGESDASGVRVTLGARWYIK